MTARAVVISRDRLYFDRICSHILAFEGDARIKWFEGSFEDCDTGKLLRFSRKVIELKRTQDTKMCGKLEKGTPVCG